MSRTIAGVTNDAVENATGEDWNGWLDRLDERGATERNHEGIVAALEEWASRAGGHQKIAVGYEPERGLREVGETADAGYQVGVQRTLPIGQAEF